MGKIPRVGERKFMPIVLSFPLKLRPHLYRPKGDVMALQRHSDEDVLELLRGIGVKPARGTDVPSVCRGVGISNATYWVDNAQRTVSGVL